MKNRTDTFAVWRNSEKGKEFLRQHGAILGKFPRTEKQRESSRQRMITYNKSEKHRLEVIKRNKSEIGRAAARKKKIMTEAGREVLRRNGRINGLKNLQKYNTAEEYKIKHKDTAIRVLKSLKPKRMTKSHIRLSKALSDNEIPHVNELWIENVKRFVDIAIPKSKIAIEVDGVSHTNPALFGISLSDKHADDNLKNIQLERLGWIIIRFSDADINKRIGFVLSKILPLILEDQEGE